MAGLVISNSPNITLLDDRIIADLCVGKFYVDLSPSVWITDDTASPVFNGALNVQGVKISILNPYGVTIKSYGASSFDIVPPMTSVFEYTIPTQAGKQQYGTYTFKIQLTDENDTTYEVIKTVNVCSYNADQNPCDDRLRLVASCKNGTLTVYVSEPPLFKGIFAQSKTQSWTVVYPTASGHADTVSAYGYFSVQLFEGVYKVSGSVCATYNLGDNLYIRLPYAVSLEKNVKCTLDYTCIYPRIKQLNDKIASDCSEAEKNANANIVLDALRLLKSAELANDAGEDASDYINELEVLLGCKCTCDCSGSPIVNGTPSGNVAFEGCGFTKTTVGLTDIYTFNNYSYIVEVNDTTGSITVSAPAINGCVVTQTLSFNAANAYAAIKTRINSSTEYDFFAAIIKSALTGIDASCLGLTADEFNALTLKQLIQLIITSQCEGANCDGVVISVTVSRLGADVILTWATTGTAYVQIWVDGDFVDAKNATITTITLAGFADGNAHTYEIKPFCTNNAQGTSLGGSFTLLGCPTIVPPTVSSENNLNVACPYDLTGLVSPLPSGIVAEWYTSLTRDAHTIVTAPTSVIDGIYYVFAKDSNNCYSTGTRVVVTCQTSGTVTAPQNLQVVPQFGSLLVSFQSAAFPPPANSYTLKRRLYSDPDVSGSYTTLGSTGSGIVFNSSTNKWELSDVSAVNNTLYVYRAISNGGSSPYIDLTYANLVCPTLTLTHDTVSSITYSFTDSGGQIDKYVVELYNSGETTLLDSITELWASPAFPNPITGTFTGSPSLADGTYKVRVKIYIGTYVYTCAFYTTTITSDTITIHNAVSGNTISSVGSIPFTISTGSFPITPGSDVTGVHSAFTGVVPITFGTITFASNMKLYVNGVLIECVNVPSAGLYSFSSHIYNLSDVVYITLGMGAC